MCLRVCMCERVRSHSAHRSCKCRYIICCVLADSGEETNEDRVPVKIESSITLIRYTDSMLVLYEANGFI